MRQVISLTYGHAVLELPNRLCAVDVADLEDALKIQIRVLKRKTREESIQNTIAKVKLLFGIEDMK